MAEAKKPAKPGAPKEGAGKGDKKGGAVTGAVAGPVAKGRPRALGKKPTQRLHYEQKVVPAMMQKFTYSSAMQVPRFEKIVLNMGVGDSIQDSRMLEVAANELAQIAGQKPSIRRAKKSVSNFKLRENVPIGCMVTLRGARMYEFYERLINVAVPRIRDFRGLKSRSFDGRGNYSFGILEQTIFPEINLDRVQKIRGMDVTIVTSAKTDEEGRELLKLMQMPFRQN